MRVQLTQPTLLDDLVGFLQDVGCHAERVEDEADVGFEWEETEAHGFNPPNQAESELTFLIRLWLRDHTDVRFRYADRDGSWSS